MAKAIVNLPDLISLRVTQTIADQLGVKVKVAMGPHDPGSIGPWTVILSGSEEVLLVMASTADREIGQERNKINNLEVLFRRSPDAGGQNPEKKKKK